MSLRIGDEAPNFTAESPEGPLPFPAWIGDGWAILFSHPKDFTPVCTTELSAVAGLQGEFASRRCKVIGRSVDPVWDSVREHPRSDNGRSGDVERFGVEKAA